MSSKHMFIPDPHDQPEINKDRFELAGNFAIKHKPTVIVCAGDFTSLDSLSGYDKGRKSHEGKRYVNDVDSCREALMRFNEPFDRYNCKQRKNHKPTYTPRKVMLIGNHEERILRAVEDDAKLEGTMGLEDLGFEAAGWEVIPFLKMVQIDGVWYSHYFVTGISGMPIGGLNPARQIINKHMESTTSGHSHILDTAVATGPSGKRVFGLVGGCFFTHHMPWASATEHLWWRGLHLKHDVQGGEYDIEHFSMSRIEKDA